MTEVSIPERYNASMLLDGNLEAGRAERVAIRWQDERWTYGQLFERACGCARALREVGVGTSDRVLMVLDDSPAFPALFLGAMRMGAVPVPVNPLYGPDEYRYFASDSGATLIVVDPERAEKITAAAERTRVMCIGGEAEGVDSFDAVVDAQTGELPPADTQRDEAAFWLYSSGSTGRPKGVVHLHRDIPYTCQTYADHVLRLTTDDVTFSSTKLFHAYGLGNNLSFPYWAGASTVLLSGRPSPPALFDTVEQYGPTVFFSVPTLYNAMLNTEGVPEWSTVRFCVSAAEPLPPEVWQRWKERFGLVILDGVGSTEMLHIYCSNTPEALEPGSSGRPVPGYELRITGDDGREVGPGETGDMSVRGGSCFAYYWERPERTAATLSDGWFFTGDRYRRDSDGFWWYEGRADDMFKVSGLWVSPIEVENALMEHPGVTEAAVIGARREGFMHAKAIVIPKNPSAAGDPLRHELIEHCASRLHRYEQPKEIEFVDDLPRTLTGKIQRFKLRDREESTAPSSGTRF